MGARRPHGYTREKIKLLLRKNGFKFQYFHLVYDLKKMERHGFFRAQRGIANSRSHELLFLCYKGRIPKQLSRVRKFVDQGSQLFCSVLKNVPVLSQKQHALVSKEVRDESMAAMAGVEVGQAEEKDPECEPPEPMNDEAETAETAATDSATVEKEGSKAFASGVLKKRRLYRQAAGTEVPWFPHDNDIELLKEL